MNVIGKNQIAVLALAAVVSVPASAANSCNFEDGLLCGWQPSTPGGSGSTGIEQHNGNKMAFAAHTGNLSHALSQDFTYSATDQVSFFMHAIANFGGRATNSASGARFSFLNAFNVPLGTAGLYNVTSNSWLGARDSFVDNQPHTYSFSLGSVAALAGLTPTSPIAKVSISFTSSAETNFFGDAGSASVWFDNINVGVVPEPDRSALLLAGLTGLAFIAWRRQRRHLA